MAQRVKPDWILFLTIVLMVCFGMVVVYSASSVMAELRYGSSYYFILRQMGWVAVSLLGFMLFMRLDYRKFQRPVWALAPVGITIALLITVYFIGRHHRWLTLGPASLQPSEFAKPALVIFLAYFVTRRLRAINSKYTILPAFLVIALVGMAVVVADFGTAVVLIATSAVVFYVAGLEKRYFLIAIPGSLLLAFFAIASKPYRLGRIIAFVDADYSIISYLDPHGKIKKYVESGSSVIDPKYQPLQAKIAIGSGGALGVGLMQSKQKLLYLPEAHTDFIYAVVGEELGLWGSTGVLAGFMVILWRGLRLFWLAPDDFGKYLALGVTAAVFVQALMNITVVLDLGPTKGIPLPMISYGGSSLLSTLTSLGLLLSVSEQAG
ncbi:MAG: cell division protein FtsW [Acidobacteria bacterium]|nr:cell division protein FtsW [Acidobacteriota bacterium]MBI3280647.1 cell division protein FtsW [Acidobacteriota bacterium]